SRTLPSLFLIVSRTRPRPRPTLFPYTTLFRSEQAAQAEQLYCQHLSMEGVHLYRLEASALDLPVKVLHTLERADIHTIRDLVILDRKSTRLNSSHVSISYAVFCLKKKKRNHMQ